MKTQFYGASLTRRLQEERETILFELAKEKKSLRLLFEVSGNPQFDALALQLELIQLNEFILPESRLLVSCGLDLKSKIVEGTVRGIQEYYELTDEEAEILREGFWDAVQAGIGNFAGGVDKVLKKVKLKKEPEGWDQAQKIFQKVAEKEGNKVVKDLIAAIDEEVTDLESGLGSGKNDQTFPYNKHSNVFQSGANTIASVYDTVVDATDKDPGAEGFLPVEVANEIIEQLRIITQKYISDVEREKGGMYVSFGGTGEAIEDEKAEPAREAYTRLEALILEAEEGEGQLDPDEEYEKIMRGQDSPTFKRMSSMKAPMIIAGLGVSLAALGWMSQMPWFQDLILRILGLEKPTGPKIVDEIKAAPPFQFSGDLKSGEGLTQFFERAVEGAPDLGPNASSDNFLKVAEKLGGGDLDKGLKNIASFTEGAGDPGAAYTALKGLADGGKSMPIGEFFKQATEMSGTGGTIFAVHPGPKIAQGVAKKVVKEVVKGGVKSAGGGGAAAAVATLTAAGPILAGIGLGAVVAGASLAGIRHRAKKKSRMGVLNDLLATLNLVEPKPVPLPPQDDVTVQVVLTNPEEGEVVEGRSRGRYSLINALYDPVSEATVVAMAGLEGDPDLEKTGGKLSFMLPSVALTDPVPKVGDIGEIPDVVKGINTKLPDLDLDDPTVNVKVIDNRKAKKTEPVKPPVPVVPGNIAKGEHAVCVFTVKDGAEVWRILKKVTYRKYASDAKKSGDKDAPKFADRYKRYDDILTNLRADGVFVDTPELEKELTQISSGPQGEQYRATYTRTRKNRKTGETTRKKSVTGGYTTAGEVGSLGDIRKNIKGAGNKRPRGVDKYTVIYLVGNDVLSAVEKAGMDKATAKNIIMAALSKWSTDEKRPKMKDLGVTDDAVADVLRSASLAESYQISNGHQRVMVVGVKQFSKILRENHATDELGRWQKLAGIR